MLVIVKGLHVFTGQKPASSWFSEEFMEDMLWFVSQLFMAQKKMSVCFLGLWVIQYLFT